MQPRPIATAGLAVLAALAAAPAAAADKPDGVTAELAAGTLVVTGTDRADAIGLALRGDELRVAVHGRDHRVPLAGLDRVAIAPGAGADRVAVDDLGGAVFNGVETDLGADGQPDEVALSGSTGDDGMDLLGFGATTFVLGFPTFSTVVNAGAEDALTVDGGDGEDRLGAGSHPAGGMALTLEGGDGDDQLTGGRGDDLLRGGPGDDFAAGGQGADTARLGAGDDIFRWDPGEGSDAVAGQAGSDSLTFVGNGAAERFDVQPAGGDVRLTRDVGAIVMDLDGVERISGFAGGGADTVAVGDLSGTPATGSDWSLGALDGAPDALSADGTQADDAIVVEQGATNPQGTSTSAAISGIAAPLLVTGIQPADALAVNGLGGQDALDASSVAPGAFSLTFAQ